MTRVLRGLLSKVDWHKRPEAYTCDELTIQYDWPQGALELFVSLGMVKEMELGTQVWLWECIEPDVYVEPMWLPDADGRIMGYCSCGHEWCGISVVAEERRHRWAATLDGIATAIGQALGLEGQRIDDVPDWVYLLGNMEHQGRRRDVFLLRSPHRPEGAAAVAKAQRLAGSASATVLCLNKLPPVEQRPRSWRTVLSLYEMAAMENGKLVIPMDRLFEDQALPAERVEIPALAEQDLDVLEALAEKPEQSLGLAELIAAAGYGKKALRASLGRLRQLSCVAKPQGTARKGIAITEAGRRLLARRG